MKKDKIAKELGASCMIHLDKMDCCGIHCKPYCCSACMCKKDDGSDIMMHDLKRMEKRDLFIQEKIGELRRNWP